jgi:carbamoyl-phosphate synthase large subunit
MSRKTVLISAAGSSIGLEVAKSLRLAHQSDYLIGTEVSWWGEKLASEYCDKVVLIPRGDEPEFVTSFCKLLTDYNIELAFINTDPEMEAISNVLDEISVPLSCPQKNVLLDCLNKQRLHDRLHDMNLVAGTRVVSNRQDVQDAIASFGSPIWLRCAVGPRGRGSIIIENPDDAMFWIEYWYRRDNTEEIWLAHEYLPGRNLNWTSVWFEGELITSSTGERLKYFLAQIAVSGITGNVSHCRLIRGGEINEIAARAVQSIDERPHGIFAVDLREDKHGKPRITEINTRNAFRPLLYTRGGVNFSAIYADLTLRGIRPKTQMYDAGQPGLEMIRGMDFEPLFRQT